MGGKKWTNVEQQEWLENKLVGFRQACSKGKIANFLHAVNEDWFAAWPERDLNLDSNYTAGCDKEETQRIANAIKARKEQIRQWLLRNARKETCSSTSDFKKLMHVVGKRHSTTHKRKYQPVEVYQKYFAENVSDALKEAFDKKKVLTQARMLGVRRNVCNKALEEEEEDVKAMVTDKLDHLNEEWEREKRALDHGGHNDGSAAWYLHSIQHLPALLRAKIQPIAEATGWIFFIGAAGPNPAHQGNICLEKYYFGPTSAEADNDFEDSHLGFISGFQEPFLKHAENCFPKDVRIARTMKEAEGSVSVTRSVDVGHGVNSSEDEVENSDEEESNNLLGQPILDSYLPRTPSPAGALILPTTPVHTLLTTTGVDPNIWSPEPGAPSSPISHTYDCLGILQDTNPILRSSTPLLHLVVDSSLVDVTTSSAIAIDATAVAPSIFAIDPALDGAAISPLMPHLITDTPRQSTLAFDSCLSPSQAPKDNRNHASLTPILLSPIIPLPPPVVRPTSTTVPTHHNYSIIGAIISQELVVTPLTPDPDALTPAQKAALTRRANAECARTIALERQMELEKSLVVVRCRTAANNPDGSEVQLLTKRKATTAASATTKTTVVPRKGSALLKVATAARALKRLKK
ncbi:hypothetical protein H0H81_012121 [Sphagnurus paluster]|uniref:Uncharacterized protein n=1 Tax=Sphagnurus paluster TaxID=117069 RepID=A0A9P7FU52_9AGAR|nr:hypothetical protein H0H81_012121 [Sphagnurus paluster]